MTIAIVIGLLILDQITKYWAQVTIPVHGDFTMIPQFFYLTYVKNDGAAWNIFSGKQIFLIILAIASCVVLVYFLYQYRYKGKGIQIALSLMLAGAMGNVIDRILYGFVRDFLHFYIFGYDFPVFNVADSALCVGTALLLILFLIEDKKKTA